MGSLAPPSATKPNLYITGLASAYPPHLNTPEDFEAFAKQCYDTESPAFRKLLALNRNTGIATRPSIIPYHSPFLLQSPPPSIRDIDSLFHAPTPASGIALAISASAAALCEARLPAACITHSVFATCTGATSNPGYDVAVLSALGCAPHVSRALLSGVGCAGGLAALRVAAGVAGGETARGRAARVLVVACEVCSAHARGELEEGEAGVAAVLFSDGAAAAVVCNEVVMAEREIGEVDGGRRDGRAIFKLREWGCGIIPGTEAEMGFWAGPLGFKSAISRDVPRLTSQAIRPMFERLRPGFEWEEGGEDSQPEDFDWALHPGGRAILELAQAQLGITQEHLRASWDIYKTRGNSSSPTVLIVLDRLRRMGEGRDGVVACSFGPGLTIEMAILERC
ncbi:chalcone synthase B [Macrophomina phaseolina]|uniref:Chalcone synthase B n=1 Tax=Macrophomina phaseolina TaxID=35725 RepID=A0ABQ8GJ28_9PEZI|nr:chalcone synthase B [Macrophomina phaseolina]